LLAFVSAVKKTTKIKKSKSRYQGSPDLAANTKNYAISIILARTCYSIIAGQKKVFLMGIKLRTSPIQQHLQSQFLKYHENLQCRQV